jgi:hypothetical protein
VRTPRKWALALTASVAVVSMMASPASASVAFDSSTGTGFVGKGDIQVPLGWNNQALQKNAAGLSFTYDAAETYDAVCEWDTVTGGKNSKVINHEVLRKLHTSVSSAVAYDARVKNQITGFTLKGLGAVVIEGTAPVLGGECHNAAGGDSTAVWTSVTLVETTGGLNGHYGDTTIPLPNTPIVITTTI